MFIDCVKSPSPAAMATFGVTGVARYLAYVQLNTVFKRLTSAELATLRAAGVYVLPNWEQGAQDWLGGTATAIAQANEAVRQLAAFGFPPGTPCPASNDMDMTRTQWLAAGRDYAYAWDLTLRVAGYRPGVYGSTDVLDWYRSEINPDAFLWQSMSAAWCGGRNAVTNPHAHLRQTGPGIIGGVGVDYNTVVNEWRTATPKRSETMLISIILPDGSNVDGFADGLGGWHHINTLPALAAAEQAAGVAAPTRVTLDVARDAFNLAAMDDQGNMPDPATPAAGTVHVTGDLTVS